MSTYDNELLSAVFDPSDGIAVLTMRMEGRVNKVNLTFTEGLVGAMDWLDGLDGLKGVVLTSGHRDFCVGADLDMVYEVRDPTALFATVGQFHQVHRRIETGVPWVAALAGSALGGGLEMALVCHNRICVDDGRILLGLPEVQLGVIPGGGGTQRLPRLLGIQKALEVMSTGNPLRPAKAKSVGLVQLVPDADSLLPAAKQWLADNPRAKQPWDRGAAWPGGVQPGTPDARNLFLAASAMAYKRTAGAYPAVESLLSAVQEGSTLVFERALEVEARHFTHLVISDQAKDMIRTLFFHKQAADKLVGLPKTEDPQIRKVAILGAGMMGAGLAFVCAKAGYEVVVRDIAEDAVARGQAHIDGQIARLKHLDDAARQQLAGRITATTELAAVQGADLVIEAVIEKLEIKHQVTRETEPLLAPNAIWASNTSAIPITDLAEASSAPERFIGLHFFSPVEKMPLLEVIRGQATSGETLARALAFGRSIKKTNVVVNDGYGFFTSRVFSSYMVEGAELVAEGHDPVLVEWAARTAGMVVPPLQVADEVSLSLAKHALQQGASYLGPEILERPGPKLLAALFDAGRPGKAGGAGFYDYKDGKRRGFWSGLSELSSGTPAETGVDVIAKRLMYAQLAETGRALEEGIVREHRDADVMSVFGIGFAPNTGGPLAMMDRIGLPALVAELDALAEAHGARYAPAPVLRRMAEAGERFFDEV